jgi:hypothetical protein
MNIDDQLRRAGDRLNAELDQVPVPELPGRHRMVARRAVAVAAVILVVGGAFGLNAWLLGRGAESTPATEQGPTTRSPREMVPTGVHLLTYRPEYFHVAADTDGSIWAAGEGRLAHLDPDTGEVRAWDESHDEIFAGFTTGLAPAYEGGVWLIQPDHAPLVWFDGERFRDVVEVESLAPEQGFADLVESPDGSLYAALPDRGVFRWDGWSWTGIDGARPPVGAAALAIDAAGTLWAGNLEVVPGVPGADHVPDQEIGHGVSRFDGERWETFTASDSAVLSGVVLTIAPHPDGSVRVATDAGVARFDGTGWSEVTAEAPPPWQNLAADVGPDGTVWLATASGGPVRAARFDGTAWITYGSGDGLPAESRWIMATPLATEAGVFVGTTDGVFRFDDDRWNRVLPDAGDAPAASPEASAPLAGVRGLRSSGGFLWAWGDSEIWRYADGDWSYYSITPSGVFDLAFGGDTLWVLAGEFRILSVAGDQWTQLEAAPRGAWRIAADPGTGTLWMSTGEDLFGWDGENFLEAGHPPNNPEIDAEAGYVGGIAVTTDGSVWAAGLYGYVPEWGSLARYDPVAGSWDVVRPLGGDDGVPAAALAPLPDGGLWVLLADWPDHDSPDGDGAGGEASEFLTLTRRDGGTGAWTVYEGSLPGVYPFAMGADADAVWLAQGCCAAAGSAPTAGVIRFDGEASTQYLTGLTDEVDGIAVAEDGTVWYVFAGRLHELYPADIGR